MLFRSAYVYTRNADQAKYGSLTTGWRSQFLMGNDQYPQTLSKATDILSNHKYDNVREQKKKPNQLRNDEQSCGMPGTIETSFAQGSARTCYCCGETGHIAPHYPKKNELPQDQWLLIKPFEASLTCTSLYKRFHLRK